MSYNSPCTPPPAPVAVDKPADPDSALLTPRSTQEPAPKLAGEEITSDNDGRKRKERDDSSEPEPSGKKPRANAPDGGPHDGCGADVSPGLDPDGKENDDLFDQPETTFCPEPPVTVPPPGQSILRGHSDDPYMRDEERRAGDREFGRFLVRHDQISTTFNDVHSSPDTINALRLLTMSLRDPGAFQVGILSRHSSTGILLYGPPGTGKTMLARALAKEAGVKMIVISYADIQSELVSVGERNIKSLFQYARHHHPCIIFIDEAESCFRSRSAEGNKPHRVDFLNQFLTEMEGFDAQTSTRPIVVAATNRPFDIDEGILRRLGRRIMVGLPDVRGREAILNLQLGGETLHPDLDLAEIARNTHDFTGSDLRDLAFQAAIEAVQEIHDQDPADEKTHCDVSSRKKSGADRVIRRAHFLSARKSVCPAPKADLVAKLADFHARYGSVGGGKGNANGIKQNHGKRGAQ